MTLKKFKINDNVIEFKVIDKLWNFLSHSIIKNTNRYILLLGARASGKSRQIAYFIVTYSFMKKNKKGWILRKTQTAQKKSTFEEVLKIISDWDLYDLFTINLSSKIIKNNLTNHEIIYTGLYKSESVKSTEGINYAWIEEADQITKNDFDNVNGSIRQAEEDFIIFSFNPPVNGIHNWICQEFIYSKNKEVISFLKTTMYDNPFLPKAFIKEREKLKDRDFYRYRREVLGEIIVKEEALVLSDYKIVDNLDVFSYNVIHKSYGLDYGFNDPSVIMEVYYLDNDVIYISNEYYRRSLSTREHIGFIEKIYDNESDIFCDTSNKSTTKDLKIDFFKLKEVEKGKNSILKGLDFLRSKEIIVNKKCKNFLKEAQLYVFKEDKLNEGGYLNEPIDNHNHCFDAIRYALNKSIFKKKNSVIGIA